MAVHFHPLVIKEISKETIDCVSITFDIPAELRSDFEFTHGQNITLKANIDGEEIRRSYSICSAPFENKLTVAVKKVEGGKFSTYANEQLKKGMTIDVLSPTGKFNTELKKENKKNYTAFAAGSGITPVISIIKTTLASEPGSTFTLVYGNRNRHSIIFLEELEGLKNKYLDRFNLIILLSREKTEPAIFSGRIDIEKLEALDKIVQYKIQDEFFICGPEEMLFLVKDFLEKSGTDGRKIHFELFTTPGIKKEKKLSVNVATKDKFENKISVKLDGRSFDFTMGYNSGSILDEALKAGADLPFSCKGGVCCTCKAKLLEGEVDMDVHWGLEEEEMEKGFILTCQSHPKTERVVVDFDAR